MANEMLGNGMKEPMTAVVILTNDQGGRQEQAMQVLSLRTGRNVRKEGVVLFPWGREEEERLKIILAGHVGKRRMKYINDEYI